MMKHVSHGLPGKRSPCISTLPKKESNLVSPPITFVRCALDRLARLLVARPRAAPSPSKPWREAQRRHKWMRASFTVSSVKNYEPLARLRATDTIKSGNTCRTEQHRALTSPNNNKVESVSE